MIIERLERSGGRVLEHLVQSALGFAGKQRDAHCLCAIKILIDALEHADRAGNMKATNADFDGSCAQWRGDVERTWKLVRLYPDQHDHAVAGTLNHACQAIRTDARIRLVVGVNI